jgi:hypothetical protein
LRLVTDPTFDPPRSYDTGPATFTKLAGPAIAPGPAPCTTTVGHFSRGAEDVLQALPRQMLRSASQAHPLAFLPFSLEENPSHPS